MGVRTCFSLLLLVALTTVVPLATVSAHRNAHGHHHQLNNKRSNKLNNKHLLPPRRPTLHLGELAHVTDSPSNITAVTDGSLADLGLAARGTQKNSIGLCVQVDVTWTLLGVHGAINANVEIAGSEITASIEFSIGVSFSLIFVKGTFYGQGMLAITAQLPPKLANAAGALVSVTPMLALRHTFTTWIKDAWRQRSVVKNKAKFLAARQESNTNINAVFDQIAGDTTPDQRDQFILENLMSYYIAKTREMVQSLFFTTLDQTPRNIDGWIDMLELAFRRTFDFRDADQQVGAYPKCSKTDSKSKAMPPAAKAICYIVKSGHLPPWKRATSTFSDGHSKNVRDTVMIMFRELLPVEFLHNMEADLLGSDAPKPSPDHNKLTDKGYMTQGFTTWYTQMKGVLQVIVEEGIASQISEVDEITSWSCMDTFIALSSSPANLEKWLTDITTDSTFDGKQVKILSWERRGSWGFTIGKDVVGFCTPDSNPVQFLKGTTTKVSYDDSGPTKTKTTSSTLTIAVHTVFALDITWEQAPGISYADLGLSSLKSIGIRFRIPTATQPTVPPADEEQWTVAGKSIYEIIVSLLNLMRDQEDVGFPKWQKAISDWLVGDPDASPAKVGVLSNVQNALPSTFVTSGLREAFQGFIGKFCQGVAKSLAGAFVPATAEIVDDKLFGFDLEIFREYKKDDSGRITKTKGAKFRIASEQYTGAVATGSTPSGFNLGAQFYLTQGSEFEWVLDVTDSTTLAFLEESDSKDDFQGNCAHLGTMVGM